MSGDFKAALSRTLERAIWIGAVGTLVGVLLVIWGSNETGSFSIVLTNVGVAVMTVGLAGVLYDLLMRRILVAEIFSVVGVRDNVKEFGLRKIVARDAFDLTELLTDAEEVIALPLDPARWIEDEFAQVRRCARQRPLSVTILLPAKDSPYIQILSERLGKTQAQVTQAVDQAATGRLGNAWTAGPVHSRASLTVKRYAGVPATGLVMTDKAIAVEIGPLIRYRELDREDFVILTSRSGSPLEQWVVAQLEREEKDENFSEVDQRPHVASNTSGGP
jgi:hypothetical protein